MNFKSLYQAETAAQEIANMTDNRMMIYKPFNRDSYEVVTWNISIMDNENFVSEVSPASSGF